MQVIMDPGFLSIFGFGAVVIVGGMVMAAVSFFSMKETTYEAIIEKKRHEIDLTDQDKGRTSKQKRDNFKKKSGPKKKKSAGQGESTPSEPTGGSAVKKNVEAVAAKVENKPRNEVQKKEAPPKAAGDPPQAAKAPQLKTTKKNVAVDAQQKAGKAEAADLNASKKKEVGSNKKVPKADEKKPTKAEDKKAKVDDKKAKVVEKKAKSDDKKSPKVEDKKAKSDDKKATKANKSDDKKSGVKVVQHAAAVVETSSKSKKKAAVSSGEALAETIRSTSLDDDTVFMLVELLNEKSNQGQWMPADSRKAQAVDLQRQLEQKIAENSRHSEEILRHQLKLKQTNQELESLKAKNREVMSALKQVKNEDEASKQELRTKLEEKQQQIHVLQSQVQNASEVSSQKNLRDENNILRQTIQANAAKMAENQMELQMVKKQLDESMKWKNRCGEIELKLNDYQVQTQRQTEADATYSKHVEELKLKILTADARYGQLETEYQKVQNDLQIKQSESAKLLEQVAIYNNSSEQNSTMEKQIADTKQALEQRLLELDANENERAEEVAKLYTLKKDLLKQLEESDMKNNRLQEELLQQRNSANKASETMQKSNDVLSEKDGKICELEAAVAAGKDEAAKFQADIEKLKKKNNELRERNWKAMDAVSVAENASREKVTASQEEAKRAMNSMQSDVKTAVQTAFPSASSSNKEFSGWLNEFLQCAKKSSGESESALQAKEGEMKKLEQEITQVTGKLKKQEASAAALQQSLDSALKRSKTLEGEVDAQKEAFQASAATAQKYKSILASTEEILQSLQNSVELEEKDKNSGNEERVKSLKQQLENKTMVVDELKSENDRLAAECMKMQTSQANQYSGKEDQGFVIVDDQPRKMTADQESEVAKLKERLDKEKELTKSLGEAAKKLQSLLKQTQDELNKERKKNQEVQDETN